jgi:Ran GTPase-activating protein (RanGAP) involved in mRNA processing and transport
LQIDLSQRGLQPSDAKLVKMALLQNANLTVLKLGYNNLGDAGVETLAAGIASHKSLNLLDLGFNNIGDDGMRALAKGMQEAAAAAAISSSPSLSSSYKQQQQQQQQQPRQSNSRRGTLQTLYLAGNLIGEDGAMAIADFIRHGSRLQKLYLTGNRIGGDGVKAITEAIIEEEIGRLGGVDEGDASTMDNDETAEQYSRFHTPGAPPTQNSNSGNNPNNFRGMQELFFGGTGMGTVGCRAVSRLLQKSCSLRVISLPNCDIGDDEIAMLASSIKSNKDRLPVESIQLSFNKMTHKGLETLTNALWGSTTLKELEVDNNEIGDRGAHHMAAIIPAMKALQVLDVGFNRIKTAGLNVLMKTVAESRLLQSLSVSGNAIDVHAAKAVAYALAYNCSLESIHLVHCSIGHEGQRHISAGIVSNSRTALRKLTGFEIARK